MTAFTLKPQLYGIAMAQCAFGGPRGVWLECTVCPASDRIHGKRAFDLSDAEASAEFRKAGWTGQGTRMLKARCPKCSADKEPRS